MSTLIMTPETLRALKRKHDKAVKEGEDHFLFDWQGDRHEFMTRYAYYLIEHTERTWAAQTKKRH